MQPLSGGVMPPQFTKSESLLLVQLDGRHPASPRLPSPEEWYRRSGNVAHGADFYFLPSGVQQGIEQGAAVHLCVARKPGRDTRAAVRVRIDKQADLNLKRLIANGSCSPNVASWPLGFVTPRSQLSSPSVSSSRVGATREDADRGADASVMIWAGQDADRVGNSFCRQRSISFSSCSSIYDDPS